MNIKLSDHFTYKKLFRFTFPSIVMMIFISIYGMVDGFFVSNFAGETAFTAVNFIWPYVMMFASVGFMFGAGGSAIIGKTLGMGNKEEANAQFSLIVYATFILGVIFTVIGYITIRPVAVLLGGEGEMLELAVRYARFLMPAMPFWVLQLLFENLYATAEKPRLGFIVTLIAGCTNIVLDAVLVGVFRLGVTFAAIATAMSEVVAGVFAITYFSRKNTSLLRLGKCKVNFKVLFRTVTNGSSELLNNIAMSFISLLYNIQLLKYVGENGVAANGVLMYVGFTFIAIFVGYSNGVAPIVSYNYGAQNKAELTNIFKKSIFIMVITSCVMLAVSEGMAPVIAKIFVGYDPQLLELTKRAFFFYSFYFLFCGIAAFSSTFFTALNNGLISALISFCRTLVAEVLAVMLLPLIFGVDGIWVSSTVAEAVSATLGAVFLIVFRKKYGYTDKSVKLLR